MHDAGHERLDAEIVERGADHGIAAGRGAAGRGQAGGADRHGDSGAA
jgi:hypothetical protein